MVIGQLVVSFVLVFLLLLGLFVARESWPDYQRRRRARTRPRQRGGYIAPSLPVSAGANPPTAPSPATFTGSSSPYGSQRVAGEALAARLAASKTGSHIDYGSSSERRPGGLTTAADGMSWSLWQGTYTEGWRRDEQEYCRCGAHVLGTPCYFPPDDAA